MVLIDGQRLAPLMIECDLGVSVAAVYEVKRIDTDFFVDEYHPGSGVAKMAKMASHWSHR